MTVFIDCVKAMSLLRNAAEKVDNSNTSVEQKKALVELITANTAVLMIILEELNGKENGTD